MKSKSKHRSIRVLVCAYAVLLSLLASAQAGSAGKTQDVSAGKSPKTVVQSGTQAKKIKIKMNVPDDATVTVTVSKVSKKKNPLKKNPLSGTSDSGPLNPNGR